MLIVKVAHVTLFGRNKRVSCWPLHWAIVCAKQNHGRVIVRRTLVSRGTQWERVGNALGRIETRWDALLNRKRSGKRSQESVRTARGCSKSTLGAISMRPKSRLTQKWLVVVVRCSRGAVSGCRSAVSGCAAKLRTAHIVIEPILSPH